MARERVRPAVLPYQYATILILAFAFFYTAVFDKDLEVVGDNAAYYILGKALYQGQGYTYINSPATPPAINLPPGYPALIALTMALWSSDFAAMKLVNGIFFLLSVLGLFALTRTLTDNVHLALVVSLAALSNGYLLRWSTLMMSEMSFLFFSIAALLLCTRLAAEDFRRPQIYLLLLCLVAAFYIRTVGVALLIAIGSVVVRRKHWKYLAFLVTAYIAAILPWYIRGRRLGGNPYIDQLLSVNPYRPELGSVGPGDLVERLIFNAKRYIYREIPDGLLCQYERNWADGSTAVDWVLGFSCIALSGYGLYKLPRHRWLIAVYGGTTAGVLLFWPQVWQGTRFLVPLIPLLLLACFNGLYSILRTVLSEANMVRRAGPLALLPVLLINAEDVNYMHKVVTIGGFSNAWVNYFEMARWTAIHTEADAIVACRKPSLFYLFSNRRTVPYKFTADNAELIADLRDQGVDYVVTESLGYSTTPRYLVPAIQNNLPKFSAAHKLDKPLTWLLRFHPSD